MSDPTLSDIDFKNKMAELPLKTITQNIFRLLRAFKPLFDASLEELSKNESIGEAIPISMVIQLIISRSPKDLKSPFQVADWTPRTRYQPTHINLFFI